MVLTVSPGNASRRHRSSGGQNSNERPHDVLPKPAKLICSRHPTIVSLTEASSAMPGATALRPYAAKPCCRSSPLLRGARPKAFRPYSANLGLSSRRPRRTASGRKRPLRYHSEMDSKKNVPTAPVIFTSARPRTTRWTPALRRLTGSNPRTGPCLRATADGLGFYYNYGRPGQCEHRQS
jgi:hypothetical protein